MVTSLTITLNKNNSQENTKLIPLLSKSCEHTEVKILNKLNNHIMLVYCRVFIKNCFVVAGDQCKVVGELS